MNSLRTHRIIIAVLCLALAATIYYPVMVTPQPIDCEDYSMENPSTLETTAIDDMVQQYQTKQLPAVKTIITHPDGDAHSVWFNLKTLKKFIYHIEYHTKNNDPSNTKELGLRLYYAAYPSSLSNYPDLRNNVDPAFINRHTVVMIPTIYNDKVGHVDFNPQDTSTFEGYISQTKAPNVETYPYQVAGYRPMALTNNQRVTSQNHGSLIPPANNLVEGF